MPEVLIITPESLHILFAQKNHDEYFSQLDLIVVDEWHELLGSKRGVLTQLGIALLLEYRPKLSIWGISATIDNLDEALDALVWGKRTSGVETCIIKNPAQLQLDIETLIPDEIENFPWSGHLGIKLVPQVNDLIQKSKTTLVFTNTRSQCEIWYQKLLDFNPDLAGQMALHHSAIDADIRGWIEDALKEGRVKVVVCTSTLDLGVDFHPVETIIQIGSPKGVARFLQRAGRSGHRPDARSKAILVPTHAIELIESAALELAIKNGSMEGRTPFLNTHDLALQFLTTLAVGNGLNPDQVKRIFTSIYAYKDLNSNDIDELIQFLITGGKALKSYDDYQKLIPDENGNWVIANKRLALRHRLTIGAIVSDSNVKIRFMGGGTIGSIEEYFISSLNLGDSFWFAGRCLELVKLKDNIAYVRASKTNKGVVASWIGGRMPLTSKLSETLQHVIPNHQALADEFPVLKAVEPLLEIQKSWSALPGEDTLLIELSKSREGHHLFCYPLEGRLVHEGLASLFAYRMSKIKPISFSIAMNDYGFELLSDQEIPIGEAIANGLFAQENLEQDMLESINEATLLRRKFREVAQLGGLLFLGYPGNMKKERHLQSSSGLLFDVFQKYDPENPLLRQAAHEVLHNQLEIDRLKKAFKQLAHKEVLITYPDRFTPFAFPIFTDRLREKLSSEKLSDRIQKMQVQLNKASFKIVS
jgi:ATP-dependent Lhr-like helicase